MGGMVYLYPTILFCTFPTLSFHASTPYQKHIDTQFPTAVPPTPKIPAVKTLKFDTINNFFPAKSISDCPPHAEQGNKKETGRTVSVPQLHFNIHLQPSRPGPPEKKRKDRRGRKRRDPHPRAGTVCSSCTGHVTGGK